MTYDVFVMISVAKKLSPETINYHFHIVESHRLNLYAYQSFTCSCETVLHVVHVLYLILCIFSFIILALLFTWKRLISFQSQLLFKHMRF